MYIYLEYQFYMLINKLFIKKPINIIKYISFNKAIQLDTNPYDFILYNNNTDNIIYSKVPSSFEYKCASYKFITVNINTTNDINKKEEINKHLDLKGFYIANNKIDKYVICYLLNQQHNINVCADTCKYQLYIIDHNANIINIDEMSDITLYENEYIINNNIKKID